MRKGNWLALCLAVPLACDSSNQTTPSESGRADKPVDEQLFPLAIGTEWTYRNTEGENVGVVVRRVEDEVVLSGGKDGVRTIRMSSRFINEYNDDARQHFFERVGDQVHEHQFIDPRQGLTAQVFPYQLWIDEARAPGEHWNEMDRSVTDRPTGKKEQAEQLSYSAEADEMVTVPAGTFQTRHFRQVSNDGGEESTWDIWVAAGIGMVKNQNSGAGTLMELMTRPTSAGTPNPGTTCNAAEQTCEHFSDGSIDGRVRTVTCDPAAGRLVRTECPKGYVCGFASDRVASCVPPPASECPLTSFCEFVNQGWIAATCDQDGIQKTSCLPWQACIYTDSRGARCEGEAPPGFEGTGP
jgi:hypothetical protein